MFKIAKDFEDSVNRFEDFNFDEDNITMNGNLTRKRLLVRQVSGCIVHALFLLLSFDVLRRKSPII